MVEVSGEVCCANTLQTPVEGPEGDGPGGMELKEAEEKVVCM